MSLDSTEVLVTRKVKYYIAYKPGDKIWSDRCNVKVTLEERYNKLTDTIETKIISRCDLINGKWIERREIC